MSVETKKNSVVIRGDVKEVCGELAEIPGEMTVEKAIRYMELQRLAKQQLNRALSLAFGD